MYTTRPVTKERRIETRINSTHKDKNAWKIDILWVSVASFIILDGIRRNYLPIPEFERLYPWRMVMDK